MKDKRLPRGALIRMALEAAAIVFAVLLALWVDQMVKAREERALARSVLEDFQAEITDNREVVARRAAYHLESLGVLDSLLAAERAGQNVDLTRPPLRRGFGFEPIMDTMWETAALTDVLSLLDFSTVSPIARVYQTQRTIADIERILLGGVIRPETFSGGDAMPTLFFARAILGDLTNIERDLDGFYGEALDTIAAELGGDLPIAESSDSISARSGPE